MGNLKRIRIITNNNKMKMDKIMYKYRINNNYQISITKMKIIMESTLKLIFNNRKMIIKNKIKRSFSFYNKIKETKS